MSRYFLDVQASEYEHIVVQYLPQEKQVSTCTCRSGLVLFSQI